MRETRQEGDRWMVSGGWSWVDGPGWMLSFMCVAHIITHSTQSNR